MELYAKGQLSYLILNCLLERDFYGLDIITEINSKSAGKVNLKKPSVYSNLTRMEKQGYVSSYLKSSDLGPNRKYYSITDSGRDFYKEIEEYFARNNIDVFSDFSDDGNVIQNSIDNLNIAANDEDIEEDLAPTLSEENEKDMTSSDDFFDFSGVSDNNVDGENEFLNVSDTISDNKKQIMDENVVEDEKLELMEDNQLLESNSTNSVESDVIELSEDFESQDKPYKDDDTAYENTVNTDFINEIYNTNKTGTEETGENENNIVEESQTASLQEENTSKDNYKFSIRTALLSNANEDDSAQSDTSKDDAVFLNRQEVTDYNQRLYDISKDINSYKKKKSFAEDQISITTEAPLLSSSVEKRKANLEDFKNSLLQNKNNYSQGQDSFSRFMNYKDKTEDVADLSKDTLTDEKQETENRKDDAKFIIAHINESDIEKPRKIQPPKLKILPENGKEKLPAPKRDSSIDPSHQEILSQLYAKTKGSNSEEQREDCLYDYNDLKDFYKNQNIAFDVYQKPQTKVAHNTNKLYFIASLITFLCACGFSAITYLVLSKTSMLNIKMNFLYLVLPALLIVDVCVQSYNMVKYKGWLPKQILPQWQIWTITFALMGICVGLNFACGMATTSFAKFATTLILPLLFILICIPFRYYVKRTLIVKRWK